MNQIIIRHIEFKFLYSKFYFTILIFDFYSTLLLITNEHLRNPPEYSLRQKTQLHSFSNHFFLHQDPDYTEIITWDETGTMIDILDEKRI